MVNQIERLQEQSADRARWFRLGMMSATAMAPLVTRWRSLRAAERARALWEASQRRGPLPWSAPRVAEPVAAPPRANVRAGLWLAGAGIGLVAAGAVAFVVARRRMLAREEPPLELPFSGLNSLERQQDERAHAPVAAPAGGRAASAEPAAPASAASTPAARNASAAATVEDREPGASAPIIGDLHTLTYFEAGSPNLPEETDRIYFRSAQDARAAGFHEESESD